MSSIENPVETGSVEAFFLDEVVPLSRQWIGGSRSLFAAGPDPSVDSYYVNRKPTTTPREQVFEIDPAAMERNLVELWSEQGFPELAPLASSTARLADELRQKVEQDATVSPFIYVMF